MLGDVKATHAGYDVREIGLRCQVSELGNDIQGLDQKCSLLAAEKATVEEVRVVLDSKVHALTQVNEGLMIQNESLERDIADRDKLIATIQADVEATRCDLDWLLRVGLVRVVDKLVEHPDFTGVMSLIHHSAFVAGVESSRSGLMSETGSRSVRSNIGSVPSVNDALLAFASMDHASLLGLGIWIFRGFMLFALSLALRVPLRI